MKFRVKRYGDKIVTASQGLDISFNREEGQEIGEIELDQNHLDKVDIRVRGKKIEVRPRIKSPSKNE